MMSNAAKSFHILATSLNFLHHYFDGPTKLFLDLYLTFFKFLDTFQQNRSFRIFLV